MAMRYALHLTGAILFATNGTFATQWRIGDTSSFVAQILGDADHAGAGTRELRVTVKPRPKRR
jgi:hypothetical protein